MSRSCDGLEYTRKKKDPAKIYSFGHRYDGNSNCYCKLEMTFSQASEKCAAHGGHLLRLDNEDELFLWNVSIHLHKMLSLSHIYSKISKTKKKKKNLILTIQMI